MRRDQQVSCTRVQRFSYHDEWATVEDDRGQSWVISAGADGCIGTVADNAVLRLDERIEEMEVQGNILVGFRVNPLRELVRIELGSVRPLWMRNEGVTTGEPPLPVNLDLDRKNAVFGSAAGAYEFSARAMRHRQDLAVFTAEISAVRDDLWLRVADRDGEVGDIFAYDNGDNDFFDPRALPTTAIPTGNFPFVTVVSDDARARQLGFDGDTIAWSSLRDNAPVGVVRLGGPDHALDGAEPACEVSASDVGAVVPGWAQVRAAGSRALFIGCGDATCSPSVDGPVVLVEGSAAGCVKTVLGRGRLGSLDGRRAAIMTEVPMARPFGMVQQPAVVIREEGQPDYPFPVIGMEEIIELSGPRLAFIDRRSSMPRVVIADLDDGSTRTLGFGTEAATNVRLEGPRVVWTEPAPGRPGISNIHTAHLGLTPRSVYDEVNPGPTRLRCPTDDDFEENDSAATATLLNAGGGVNGIVCTNDEDRFAVVAAVGCELRASAAFRHADGDLSLALFDPDGALVASSTTSNDLEEVTFVAQNTGRHIVRLTGVNGAENTYDVGVGVICP
jgi:hypothetical protein